MKKNTAVFLFALCPLVPAASNLAYGIVLAAACIWLLCWGLIFREIVRLINAGNAGPFVELACLAGSATLFNLLLQLFFPVLAISLSLYVYLSAFSCVLLVSIDNYSFNSGKFVPVFPFVPVLLGFSAFRELLGHGTISFPVPSGITHLDVFPAFEYWGIGFWGTSAGALILLGILVYAVTFIDRKASGRKRNV
jgi:Na+-translocating ferredoxin:NAD+ oxidoreductase RnfE subunit